MISQLLQESNDTNNQRFFHFIEISIRKELKKNN